MQGDSEQRPHKVSYKVKPTGKEAEALIAQASTALQDQGINAKLIYSGGEDLDVLPQGASKGKGLEFLLNEVCPRHIQLLLPETGLSGSPNCTALRWLEVKSSMHEPCVGVAGGHDA